MEPQAIPVQPLPETPQVTAEFAVFCSLAVNCLVFVT
jgi:hypothetical protein